MLEVWKVFTIHFIIEGQEGGVVFSFMQKMTSPSMGRWQVGKIPEMITS